MSKEKLESFYRRVRPGGFWGILDPEVRNLPGKAITRRTVLDIAGGLMLCYGLSLMIGYTILLKFAKAGICLALAAVGGFIVYGWYKKEVNTLKQFSASDKERQHG